MDSVIVRCYVPVIHFYQILWENLDSVLISAPKELVAPPPSLMMLMLSGLQSGYTYLLLQNMAGRAGGGAGKGVTKAAHPGHKPPL